MLLLNRKCMYALNLLHLRYSPAVGSGNHGTVSSFLNGHYCV